MSATHHVVWDNGETDRPPLVVPPEKQLVLRCLRCGDHYVLPLPLPIVLVAAFCKAYSREHARCRKPRASE